MSEPVALRLTAEDLAALARSRPAAPALAVLRRGQVSRRLLLLKGLADAARRTVPEAWARDAAAGWELCVRAYAADPRAFEGVLLHPHAGVWLRRCLRALHGTGPGADLTVDLARLGTFGHAAALRAGLRPALSLPVRDGTLWLPTLGVVRLSGGANSVRLDGWTVAWADRTVSLRQGSRENPREDERERRFTPHRLVVPPSAPAAPRLSVTVEDADPYRDVYGFPVQSRQSPARLAAWQSAVERTWALLSELMPERAADCAYLWSALVPLRPGPRGRGRSSSSREAYGALAAAPQRDPLLLAETVLHETGHLALGSLTDLVDLTDPYDRTLHRVGWRPDPRPLAGVLTGTHAHIGLLDFWSRAAHTLGGAQARLAEQRLRLCGSQAAGALRVLRRNRAALTSWGACFVEHMTEEAEAYGFLVDRRPVHPSGQSDVRGLTPFRVVRTAAEDAPPSGAARVRPPPPRSTRSA
ncbi:aKG-HExxH-type peptide beta-hydroxylase [Streptomyces griseorubiginosus]|uniref:aKG-HExxH-type peptide beta-hydroxylase n=1 Tax=Streptomyces griseorubiginosus TaxID=67304 RepID=UPI0011400A0E|nr:HEXXH motif-containing putative peptide modification protein [Streptomyces griseorubiginosus]